MITIKKLNCGTTVIMEKTERVQSAALGIWVKAGASDEWDDVSGVSHFIEHMMFKGTETRTAKQIAEDVDKIGGVFNAFTGKEATCYYIKTLSSGGDGPGAQGYLRGDQDGEGYAGRRRVRYHFGAGGKR